MPGKPVDKKDKTPETRGATRNFQSNKLQELRRWKRRYLATPHAWKAKYGECNKAVVTPNGRACTRYPLLTLFLGEESRLWYPCQRCSSGQKEEDDSIGAEERTLDCGELVHAKFWMLRRTALPLNAHCCSIKCTCQLQAPRLNNSPPQVHGSFGRSIRFCRYGSTEVNMLDQIYLPSMNASMLLLSPLQ